MITGIYEAYLFPESPRMTRSRFYLYRVRFPGLQSSFCRFQGLGKGLERFSSLFSSVGAGVPWLVTPDHDGKEIMRT